MKKAIAGLAVVIALALAWWWLARTPAPPAEPPALARLARGVNLSNWLQHGPPTEAERYAPDADDWRRIRALGLAHARLPVDPSALAGDDALAALRAAIEAAHAEDLLVVLAVQLPPPAKAALAASASEREALAGAWRRIAGALRDLPPSHLAFEPLNEPEIADAKASRELMAYLAAELRAVAPAHTLVISGHRYSSVDELEALRPLDDRNIVYGFHFYEPHDFTHQGATWGDPRWAALHGLSYPGVQGWDAARVRERIARAAQWGRRHGVPVWCSEFGVLKTRAGAADRAAWLNDVRVALESNGIGWTHWDYAGDFGIVSGPRGKRVADARAIEALGLK